MKLIRPSLLPLSLLLLASTTASGQDRAALEEKIGKHVNAQMAAQDQMTYLSAAMGDRVTDAAEEHIWHAYFRDHLEIVTEQNRSEGIYTRKDYFLQDSKVIAFMTEHHEPTLDEKKKRISESAFGFQDGRLVSHSVSVYRRSVDANRDPELAVKHEKDLPIQPGFDGFQQQLTQRAFDIARRLKEASKEQSLTGFYSLDDAPPATVEVERAKDWLPAADTLTLPLRTLGSPSRPILSPDGRWGVSWGYERGPVDWEKLRCTEAYREGEFCTHLQPSDKLTDALKSDNTFLRNAISGLNLGILGLDHGGEVQRFNHDGIVMHWSPSSAVIIAQETHKLGDTDLRVAWMNNSTGALKSQTLLAPLFKGVLTHVAKSKHPAAENAQSDGMDIRMGSMLVEDDGKFEARITGDVRSPHFDAGNFFEAKVYGQVSPSKAGEAAVVKFSQIKLSPPLKEEP
jgi:hypothetical protein